MPASDAPTKALGGEVSMYGGYGWPRDETEHIPELEWPLSTRTFSRMRTDATIKSVLAAYIGPLIDADWRIDPRGADPRIVQVCADSLGIPKLGEDVQPGPARRRGIQWRDHIRLAALSLIYGAMAFEVEYTVRNDSAGPTAYLTALYERMPSTIEEIKVNRDGTLQSIVQQPMVGNDGKSWQGQEITADRLLYYCNEREGAAWQGRSAIRHAYTPWTLKIDAMRAHGVGINRWSSGIPIAVPDPGTNPTPAQVAQAQQLVQAMRGGDYAGATIPGFSIRVIGVDGQLPDALSAIRYYDEQIGRGALVSIMDLGSTRNGSRALGDNFADIMVRALNSSAGSFAETATQLCVAITDFNLGTDAPSPAVVVGDVAEDKEKIAGSITNLIVAGAIRPDAELEGWLRDTYELPAAGTPYLPPAKPGGAGELASLSEAGRVSASESATNEPGPAGKEPELDGWQPWVHAVRDYNRPDVMARDAAARKAEGDKGNEGNARSLIGWYTHGAGAALIAWGTPNDFDRCVSLAAQHMSPENAKGFCNLRHHDVLGIYPATHAKIIRDGGSIAKKAVKAAGPQDDDGNPTGIMVALMVPADVASELALKGKNAEPAEDLHLTLAMLGDISEVDDPAAYLAQVLDVVGDVAARHPIVTGIISGSGRFTTPDDGDAVYLSYDSPDLPELRQDLVQSLEAAGIEPMMNHGFSPHITLAYVPQGTKSPVDHVDTRGLTFPVLTLAYGGQRFDVPLTGADDAVKASGIDWEHEAAAWGDGTREWAESAVRAGLIPSDPKSGARGSHKGHVHAAADPSSDQPAYRPPTEQETAAGLDPASVDADHDQLVAAGIAALTPIVATWGTALTATIAPLIAAGSLTALAKLSSKLDTSKAKAALQLVMAHARDAGRHQVLDEADRAGGLPEADLTFPDSGDGERAEAYAEQAAESLTSLAGRAAMQTPPGIDPEAAAMTAVGQAEDAPIIQGIVLDAVNYAMGGGRLEAQQAIIDASPDTLTWTIFHSALRDQNTCVNCAEADGHVYPSIAAAQPDFSLGRYAYCLGRSKCRCLLGMRPNVGFNPGRIQ